MTTVLTPRGAPPQLKPTVNDFIIKFANINGSGSASANTMFAKAIFRLGIPVCTRNLFPSNIQGLPTWYEVRVNDHGYLGRRERGVDIMVAMNAETYAEDVADVRPGGYLLYDNSKALARELVRDDIHEIGIPLATLVMSQFTDPKQRQLFKNIVYVGALSALLDMEFEFLTNMVAKQYAGKDALIKPNIDALNIGRQFALDYLPCPLPMTVRQSDANQDAIMVDGNDACALGALYGGATVCAWYPITPSTSVAESFEKYANRLRKTEDGKAKFAIIQAEDELSAIGMVIGGAWNGARSFTATSGPGISLMQEFIGLAYFAEIPAVICDIQRSGPSTGMPTRTQQGDLISAAYASHGDTKHPLLFPSTPRECFDLTADAMDLADRLQTPIFVMSDLELGMNDTISEPFEWDDTRRMDRGKVLNGEQLEAAADFGRYVDVDGDGIGYRTYPGAHPDKGSFFTRGTSRDAYARYTEAPEAYVENMERLLIKWETAKQLLPEPVITPAAQSTRYGIIYCGTSATPMPEALDLLQAGGIALDALRVRAFPFNQAVEQFIADHDAVFVVDQNRDGQLRTLVLNELEPAAEKLVSVRYFGGLSLTADTVVEQVSEYFAANKLPRLTEVSQ